MRTRSWVIVLGLTCTVPANAADWPSLANTIIHRVALRRSFPAPVSPLAFAQDGEGFLWAGGQAGLLRWDGYQFRAYTPSGGADDGLKNHYVQVLHTDRGGQLWVGTEEGGLARYDAATDRFEPTALADGRGDVSRVWSLDDDGDGGLWVGTNRGVAHLDARHRIEPPAAPAGSAVFAVPDRNVEALVRGRDGTLWIGGGDGLARIGGDGRALAVKLPSADGAVPEVSHLMEDSAGRIWAGTRYSGAYLIDPATVQARAVPIPDGVAPADGLEIAAMAEVEPGRVWLGTFGHGIFDIDAARLTTHALIRDPVVPGTLDSDVVLALYTERSGVTWIGTPEAIDQFVPPVGGIHTLFGDPLRPGGLPNGVSAVLARPDGSVWLGSETDGEGVAILGPDGRRQRSIKLPRVLCLAGEPGGPVYIGTRRGLFVASPKGENVRQLAFAEGRSHASVWSLLLSDGVLWVGGGDDDGLWELHPSQDGGFSVARHFVAPPLPTASIESLALAPGGLLAVGTSRGAALLNRATGEVEKILVVPTGPHTMAAGQVVSFLTDRHGRLWMGTDDSGIAVLLGRDAAGRTLFHRITTADGLPDSDVNRMLADDTGRVWVATDNGLAVIDPDNFAVQALREADGVGISTYLNSSGDRTPQGDLLFGGHGGLTVVRPSRVGSWRYQPPLAVSEILVGGKKLRTRAAGIIIEPDANSLAVEFSALDFSAPERNVYRYKLEGFDTGYTIEDARHRVASYTNLPPGKYALHLQGSNRNGAWTAPATLAITVVPAWFQRIPVRIGEVAVLVLFGGWVRQGRTLWLRRHRLHLERLVQERTSALVSSQEKLTELAYLDSLTALPNRRAFSETLLELLHAGKQSAPDLVLILIDLDGFKRVNDSLGHDAGDALLIIAAGRLRAAVREGDFVGRLGGDEFAIVLKHCSDAEAVRLVCDRVVADMTAPIELKGHKVEIGASVGVAVSPRHGQTPEDLYRRADQALYDAKGAGKGIWRWYQGTTSRVQQTGREGERGV